MSPQQGIGGRHRRRKQRAVVVTTVPVIVAIALGSATAHAAPQDFVTAPDTAQSATTDAAPATTQEREFLPGFEASPRVQQSPWRTYNDYQSGNQESSYRNAYYQAAPLAPQTQSPSTAAPAPLIPPAPTVRRTIIAPIDAPDGYILAGGELVPYDPNVLDPNLVDQFNNTEAALQADGGNWLVDNGFADAPRADRIAAGTATGIIAGGLTGLAAGLVPAAVITGTGAAIGGGLGVAATTASGAIVWGGPVGWVFIPGAAALAGAGAGAALSTPIVLGLTGTGAVIGGVLGATVLGGEQQIIEEPAPTPPPVVSAPETPPPPMADVHQVQQSVDVAVEQITAAVNSATVQAPAYVEQVRDAVAADPVGVQVAAAFDTAATDAAPLVDQAVAAFDTALAGLSTPI